MQNGQPALRLTGRQIRDLLATESSPSLGDYAQRWRVSIEHVQETRTSQLGFGRRDGQQVALKLSTVIGDERDSGAIAAAFAGHGMVRVLEHEPGAALLERLTPGTHLAEVVNAGDDERATDALAQVISALREIKPPIEGFPTVEQWGLGFERYIDSRDWQIPGELVADAHARYRNLCSTQGARRLLHGDLQHYNVLADEQRSWVAIDPKGVVGEIEFELGAALRNPHEIPDLYATASAVERRVRQLANALHLDAARILQWAYVQGVLSAIWTTEDDGFVSPVDPALCLAATIRQLLDA